MDPSTLTNTLTPLGDPMTLGEVRSQRADPVLWHLQYWLHIAILAIYRGQNNLLTMVRIDREQCIIVNPLLKNQVRSRWAQFQTDNKESFQQHWDTVSMESLYARMHIRDLNRMLVNKELKMKEYLEHLEEGMITRLRDLQISGARLRFEKLVDVYQALREEALREEMVAERLRLEAAVEAADAVRDLLPSPLIGARPPGQRQLAPTPAANNPHPPTQPAGGTPQASGIGVQGHTSHANESATHRTGGGQGGDVRAGEYLPPATMNAQTSKEPGSEEVESDEDESDEDE